MGGGSLRWWSVFEECLLSSYFLSMLKIILQRTFCWNTREKKNIRNVQFEVSAKNTCLSKNFDYFVAGGRPFSVPFLFGTSGKLNFTVKLETGYSALIGDLSAVV